MGMEGTPKSPAVLVYNLAGNLLTTVTPVPQDVALLKESIETQLNKPRALQKIVKQGDFSVLEDDVKLESDATLEVNLLQDESPLWSWDYENNPSKAQLIVEGPIVKCPNLKTDYINVITKEPIRSGAHYFEFVMHYIGDE